MQNSSFFSSRKIGLIGYGLFGKFFIEELFQGYKITVYSPHLPSNISNSNIIPVKTMTDLLQKTDFIIPSVPISKFEDVIKEISPFLKEKTIIMDVCSVKEFPVEIMKKNLRPSIQIIASHPLFGPKTFEKNKTLAGSRMVLHNISTEKDIFTEIVQHFKSLSLEILEMKENEHDKLMAGSQFFTQLVRHLALEQNLHATRIDTPASALLFKAFGNIGTKKQLLLDMIKYNRYCQKILNDSIKILSDLQ